MVRGLSLSGAIQLPSVLATDRLHLTIHALNAAPILPEDWLLPFSISFSPFLSLASSLPDTHILTYQCELCQITSDQCHRKSSHRQRQISSGRTSVSLPLLLFRFLTGFQPLSLLSLAIVCLSFPCLTCCLSTLCPLDLIHVKLSCSCNPHLTRPYFLPPLTFFIILPFCVCMFVKCRIILHV